MADPGYSTTTSLREARQALEEGCLLLARESGEVWGEVSAIESFQEQGRLTPAYRIRFASGHSRVTLGGDDFRLGSDDPHGVRGH